MTSRISFLKRGTWLRWKNRIWIVEQLLATVIYLRDTRTGEPAQLSIAQWDAECRAHTLEHIPEPGANLDEPTRALLKVPVSDLPESMKATVLSKFDYVQAFLSPENFYELRASEVPVAERILDPRCSAQSLRPLLAHVAKARGDKRPPGASTFCKWLSLYKASGEDSRALANKYYLRGPRVCFMDPRLEELLNESIDNVWLRTHGPSKNKVYDDLSHIVREWNKKHPDDELVMLTQRHVARYITTKVDKYTAVARRRGKPAADRLYKPVGIGPVPDHILDVVEIDHTPVDIDVLDDATGLLLGRPTATVLLDRKSRMILACHIHFDGPCATAVLQAIRQAILPKHFLREICPELTETYPAYGLMSCLLSDNGAEFKGDAYRDACVDLDIRQDFARVIKPEDKGKIERFFRTLQAEVSHGLPGARPPVKTSPNTDARKTEGTITFGELLARTWRWIVGVYSRRYHRGIDSKPLLEWEASAAKRLLRAPLPTERLDMMLSRIEERLVHRTGIEWKHLRWNGPVIETIMTQPGFDPGKTKVKIRINDHDLYQIFVTNPFTRLPEALTSVRPKYTKGLSYHKHLMVLAQAKERFDALVDDDVLLASKNLLDKEGEELWQRSGAKRRKSMMALARLEGIGSKGPGYPSGEEAKAPAPLPEQASTPQTSSAPNLPSDDDSSIVDTFERRPARITIRNRKKK